MVRRYHEHIEVRVDTTSDLPAGQPPVAFIWRGRLHVVREVLGHWHERRAWWRDALDQSMPPDGGGDALEQEVWRVEASIGRLMGSGVYDVVRPVQDRDEQWRLVRVAD